MMGFGVVAVGVLLVTGYLGWRAYDSPVDPYGAELAATHATEVVVRAGGGDASACETLHDITAPDKADAIV